MSRQSLRVCPGPLCLAVKTQSPGGTVVERKRPSTQLLPNAGTCSFSEKEEASAHTHWGFSIAMPGYQAGWCYPDAAPVVDELLCWRPSSPKAADHHWRTADTDTYSTERKTVTIQKSLLCRGNFTHWFQLNFSHNSCNDATSSAGGTNVQ